MLIGWRPGAQAIGCAAAILLAIVGCTAVTEGNPTADTAIAPAYRTSVSASISASAATSSLRETQRQQSLTTQAVVHACEPFAVSAKDAVDKVNEYVQAYNQNQSTAPTEGPAIEALNHSADLIAGIKGGPLSQKLRHALNAYADAARDLANAISAHADMGEFNQRINQFNDTKGEANNACRAALK